MLIAEKQKNIHKTLSEKCQALKDLEKRRRHEDVAAEYGVPRNTSSTWVKNKENHLDGLEKVSNVRRQKLKTSNPEAVDKAVFNWFLTMESQNIQLTEPTIQEKAATFENVQALDG